MIYDSLDTIPFKTFIKISETGAVNLLAPGTMIDVGRLSEIWSRLHDEHLSKNQTTESKKIFKLSKEIDSLQTKNKSVVLACECLRFDWNDDLVEMLRTEGYQLRNTDTKTYYEDLDQIEREANAYVIKADRYKSMLPEQNESEDHEYSIDDVMGSYCLILAIDFDFNTVTHSKFFVYQKQVNAKIEALKKQQSTTNGK